MSQVLTVPTHFSDIGELSEGFLDRVEHDTLILYGPVPYEDGSAIDFVVLLADGTSALEGSGRVRAAVDGGAERVPETRYDIVLEALELDGRSEVVFESLVMARQTVSEHPPAEDDAPVTGEVDAAPVDDGNDSEQAAAPEVEISSDEVFSIPPDEVEDLAVDEDQDEAEDDDADVEMSVEEESVGDTADWDEEESPVELSIDAQATLEKYANSQSEQAPADEVSEEAEESEETFEEAFQSDAEPEFDEDGEPLVAAEPNVGAPVPKPSMAAPPAVPPAPAGLNLVPPPEGLTRPSRVGADEQLIAEFEAAGDEETSGLFKYEEGLPIPSRPPLPDLDRVRRVAEVEANDVDDVEESEPPEANDDYEEIRLSEMAESAESAEEG